MDDVKNDMTIDVLSLPVEAGDIAAIGSLNAEAFGRELESVERFIEFLSQKNMFLVVARDWAGEIVGKGTLYIRILDDGRRVGWVDNVAVIKRYQKTGVGSLLDEKICKIARKERCLEVCLSSKEAGGFYEKIGYRRYETNVYRKIL